MAGAINRPVLRVVDPLDDISLFPNPGVWENRVGSREILQIALERTDVNRGTPRNIAPEPESLRDFLRVIEPGEFAHPHTHGIAGRDQAVRDWLDSLVTPIGIGGRPVSRTLYFAGLKRLIAHGRARKKAVHEGKGVDER